jgi:hypothetical protein
MSKPYDKLLGQFGKTAEWAGIQLMRSKGFDCTELPNGIYEQDVLCQSDREMFYLEVERRTSATWCKGPFPYVDVNVPIRRKATSDRIFVTFRSDLARCVVIFCCDVLAAKVEDCPNRYMGSEQFRKVPIERCLEFDVEDSGDESFARMNYRRVRDAMQCTDPSKRKLYLSPTCPYGVCGDEWRKWLIECDRELEQQIKQRDALSDGSVFELFDQP